METGNFNYSRHIYELVPTKYISYNIYKLVACDGDKILTDFIKFEDNAKRSNGYGFDVWLRIKDHEFWENCSLITGLRPTIKQNVYQGNKRKTVNNRYKPDSLILIQYSYDYKTAVVDFFNQFYTYDKFEFRYIINNHDYYLND